MVMPLIGTSGHTSVAPKRGCSPEWLRMSISSCAFFTRRNAASHTGPGSPTKVITVRLVAFPGSTSSTRTPSTEAAAATMASILARSRPSLMLGTHSMICGMAESYRSMGAQRKGRTGGRRGAAYVHLYTVQRIAYNAKRRVGVRIVRDTMYGSTRAPYRRSVLLALAEEERAFDGGVL